MNHQHYYLYLLFFGMFVSACGSQFYVDRQKDFSLKDERIKHIISINPTFDLPATLSSDKNRRKKDSKKDMDWLNEALVKNAAKNGIHLQVQAASQLDNYDAKYFNYLAPLRKEILQVLYLQDFSDVNNNNEASSSKLIQKHENGLKISSHFSHLAEKYGTAYFALQGISYKQKTSNEQEKTTLAATVPTSGALQFMSTEAETVYYTVIADVASSEIVYREYRSVKMNASNSDINAIIFDSFKIIAN